MKTIEIDGEVFEALGKLAVPFVETSPNMVLRRILGMTATIMEPPEPSGADRRPGESEESEPTLEDRIKAFGSTDAIETLREATPHVHSSFLTFLMDKHTNTTGNFRNRDILRFMKAMHLMLPSGAIRNPWMEAPYGGHFVQNARQSCITTMAHYRQPRRFGCSSGRDVKAGCRASNRCIYHPEHPDTIKNKCDLRSGAVWKRLDPSGSHPYVYGANYLDVVQNDMLNARQVPLRPLLAVFYPGVAFNQGLVDIFRRDFHLSDPEMGLFSSE